MKVVADTSPIHYLILIDQTDLLAGLFGRVFVPPAVEAELRHPSAPAVVRRTIAERPDWLETVLFKVDPTQPPVVVDTWLLAGQGQDDRKVEVGIRLKADAHGWRCRASMSFW